MRLAVSWFQNLFDARRKIGTLRKEYNEERPHSSLGYQTPSIAPPWNAVSTSPTLMPMLLSH